jgi:hypothetical protein
MIAMDLEALSRAWSQSHGRGPHPCRGGESHRPREARPRAGDIQLADGSSGLDAVNEMLGSFQVPVIFITAYPDRLLTGERPEPAFLITKPISPTR